MSAMSSIRYWNQLDEDLRIMLERFDSETTDEDEHKNQSDATTSFLAQISTWDEDEMEERLRQRVEFSTRAVGKLLQAFDRIIQRNERLSTAIQVCRKKLLKRIRVQWCNVANMRHLG